MASNAMTKLGIDMVANPPVLISRSTGEKDVDPAVTNQAVGQLGIVE